MRKYITKASERIGVESTSRDGKRAQVVSYIKIYPIKWTR